MSDLEPKRLPASADTPPGEQARVVIEQRDANGAVVGRDALSNGVAHGPMMRCTPRGEPTFEAQYAHGALSGPMRAYDPPGVLVKEAHYAQGKEHGVTTLYQDGRVAARQRYVAGVLQGESVSYAPSGQVTARLPYEAGKLEGEALYLHEGVVVRRARYRAGALEGETREYAADGTLVQSLPYHAGLLHGTARRFDPDGRVMAERRYVSGKPQEAWRDIDTPVAGQAAGLPKIVSNFEKWVKG
ncbi:toxin-antitoxin system YwqK family antitoxin [Trinickia dabaoshanensis]|uniref:toxin-antitoxin system YwqK family antitoxin n=1 Tax=Trinickia dabaoshanensis TaxID=564714 RepID=UPI0011AF82F8|nr:toxin-antitoxin system YwqK family antitoxin [Trinickia dabaoshanensis]